MCAVVKSYSEEKPVNLESILGLVVAVLLLIYLAYALLRPEKF
jgi:K+-transporting ATPase KdpF subunit